MNTLYFIRHTRQTFNWNIISINKIIIINIGSLKKKIIILIRFRVIVGCIYKIYIAP